MLIADEPANEKERLRHLKELNILDSIEEQAYDDLTLLAAQICDVPIALITLLDEKRQWFKSHHGIDARETSRDISFCSHAILDDELFVVEDTDQDSRFKDNPLVNSGPEVKFYAGAPLLLKEGIRIGTICVVDIKKNHLSVEQKKALKALARQVVSLLQLRLQVKELKKIDHAKDEFLSMVSHELRTPLTSLKGSLNIMSHLKQTSQEEIEPLLDIAERNTEHLLTIVNDMLDLASMEAGNLKMQMEKLHLTTLLQSAIELNKLYIEQCNCKLDIDIPENTQELYVYGDKARLLQVLSNLISNAAKFSPKENGQIHIKLEKIKQNVQVSIIDNGQGIPENSKHQIFTKFHQLNTTGNQKLPGTGLGLNICKHIIEAHNGEIGFTSTPKEKTKFYFRLGIVD